MIWDGDQPRPMATEMSTRRQVETDRRQHALERRGSGDSPTSIRRHDLVIGDAKTVVRATQSASGDCHEVRLGDPCAKRIPRAPRGSLGDKRKGQAATLEVEISATRPIVSGEAGGEQ